MHEVSLSLSVVLSNLQERRIQYCACNFPTWSDIYGVAGPIRSGRLACRTIKEKFLVSKGSYKNMDRSNSPTHTGGGFWKHAACRLRFALSSPRPNQFLGGCSLNLEEFTTNVCPCRGKRQSHCTSMFSAPWAFLCTNLLEEDMSGLYQLTHTPAAGTKNQNYRLNLA